MSTKTFNQDEKWLNKFNKLSKEGVLIAERSDMESREYIELLLDNMNDKNYRQIAIDLHSIEAAIGQSFVDIVAPNFLKLQTVLRKDAKMRKHDADFVARIYVGRFIRNVVEELNRKSGEK